MRRRCRSAASSEIFLVRPLLHVPKARLDRDACRRRGIAYSEDPSNRDPRFTRARLRALMPALAREGLDARGLARLAARHAARRSDHRIRGRRRARGAGAGAVAAARSDRVRDGAIRRPARRGGACGCSAAPSPIPATRVRSSLPSSKSLYEALRQAAFAGCAGPWPGRSITLDSDQSDGRTRARAGAASAMRGEPQEPLYEIGL